MLVAPRVGAWIETAIFCAINSHSLSHPAWVRGLKHSKSDLYPKVLGVAPRVGAWIETLVLNPLDYIRLSHPAWVRGLKLRSPFGAEP